MKLRPAGVFISLLMTACAAVGPDYQRPEIPAPKQWSTTAGGQKSAQAQTDHWWQSFNDPLLNRLIIDAVAANPDYKKALARIKDARAQRVAIFASALPSLAAKSNISRRLNNSSATSQSGGAGGGFGVGNQLITIFQSGFDAQWELDFFGGVRRAAEAADATLDSEIENSRDVLVTLQAEVARNYLELRANQQLLAVTRENILAQQETLNLTEIRQQSGLADSLAVAQAQAQLAATQAELPAYESLIRQAIHALGVLLGREPQALAAILEPEGTIPQVTAAVIAQLPSELLKRRPDIRRAERLLAAASANIGVATSELYPKLNLSAFLGLQNLRITDATPIGKSWSTAASLSMPILNWGNLKANIKSKEALTEEALWTYQSTVLTAFKEVEDALIAYAKEQQRREALVQAVAANRLAVQLAHERYQKGLTAFIDVLDSRQALYQSQSRLIDSETAISSQLIALYKALGGGWQTVSNTDETCSVCKNSWAESIHNQSKALY